MVWKICAIRAIPASRGLPQPDHHRRPLARIIPARAAILAEADGGLDGRPVTDAYDVDAIADEALVTQGAGYLYRFVIGVDDDEFWAIVARHIR